MTHGSTGVGIAAVADNGPRHAVFQMFHCNVNRGGLNAVAGIHSGGGAVPLGNDQRQIFFGVAFAFYAAMNARGGKSCCGSNAARNLFHILYPFPWSLIIV